MTSDPSDTERLRLILKAFSDCGQVATPEEIDHQFWHETGRHLEEQKKEEKE